MTDSSDDTTHPFVICSICHEYLNPIVQDLQSISICGHVFHELCIQQWFECCSNGKKQCPICKQTCSASNVSRLYFQSVGDSDDSITQKLQTHKDDPIELRSEVRRLELKVDVLNSALESRENDIGSISSKIRVCKEMLKKEASIKNETSAQTRKINRLLKSKTVEFNNSNTECNELQEKNMDLAKEVAACKLVSYPDLDEEEIVKLASLGKPNNKEIVDVLNKSLCERQKLYKELMIKSKDLGSEEARSRNILEKAKKQLKELELEIKIQKLRTAKETKNNEVFRALNASNKKIKDPDIHLEKTKRKRMSENINKNNNKDDVSSYILSKDDAPKLPVSYKFSSNDSVPQSTKTATTDASFISKNVHETSEHNGVHWHDYKDDDLVFVHKNVQDKPPLNIVKEASSPVLNSQEADFCFSYGLLDGTNRHKSKWCKKGQSKASGDLIAVGADGRGGTTKVLKSHNLFSFNSRGTSISAKSGKTGAKTSSSQSQGNLQIEHFFGKAGQ